MPVMTPFQALASGSTARCCCEAQTGIQAQLLNCRFPWVWLTLARSFKAGPFAASQWAETISVDEWLKKSAVQLLIDEHGALMACWMMQLRRARAWFPCIDTPQAACSFQLQVTVAADQTAIASGFLEKQTWSPDGSQKTFFYTQAIPVPACQIALAVGAHFSIILSCSTSKSVSKGAAPIHCRISWCSSPHFLYACMMPMMAQCIMRLCSTSTCALIVR